MNENQKEILISELMKSKKIKKLYDDFIVKEVPFETWVRNTLKMVSIEKKK